MNDMGEKFVEGRKLKFDEKLKTFGKGKIAPAYSGINEKKMEELRKLASERKIEELALRMKDDKSGETIMHVAMLVAEYAGDNKNSPVVRAAAANALVKAQKIGVDVSGVKKILEGAVKKGSEDVTEQLIALRISRLGDGHTAGF